ncbi:MAG: hypothetical protein JWM19_4391 [Actinomycetia bacterium]|nr:hypothetical protein [Actinomycetes bacterium]
MLALAAAWILILVTWRVTNVIYHQSHPWRWYFWYKDAGYYGNIARTWYTERPGFSTVPSRAAFFPVFPALIWLIAFLTNGSILIAGLIATVVSGAAATVGIWLLTARVSDRWVADRATLLFAAFPGAMTLVFWPQLERRQWGRHFDWGVHEWRLVTLVPARPR